MLSAETENGEKKKRAQRTHHRSPSYPMLGLEDAIESARLIYNEDKRSFTSRAVILKHLGYKDEGSGVGNRALSALKQYGLLEEQEQSGQFRVSDRAYTILFLSEASEERRAKLCEAALAPTVFREMWAKYGSDASDETLKDYLIRSKNFNPISVVEVVRNYKSTMELAKPVEITYTGGDEDEHEQEEEVTAEQQPSTTPGIQSRPGPPLKIPRVPEVEGIISTPVGKDEDRVVFAHVRFDSAIRKEFVTSLKKYLDYLETTLQ
jgi:hypothetical protein